MAKDSTYTYIHLPSSRLADLFEEFTRPALPQEDIFIPPSRLPPNPEDEDDVVPDQHAAFGIQRATQARHEPAWRDLGMEEVVTGEGMSALSLAAGERLSGEANTPGGGGAGVRGGRSGGPGAGAAGGGGGSGGGIGNSEQLAVAGLGRGAGVGVGVGGIGLGRGEVRARGGVADVGARRAVVSQRQERLSNMLPR